MKKLLSALMAVLILVSACAFAETASPAEPLKEGEMYFHGYKNVQTGYYVGVPAEWALIGINSTADNISQAEEIMGYTEVQALLKELSAENDLLLAVAPTGEQMAVTYGLSDGVTSETLIGEIDNFKKMLSAAYTGIEFKEESGAYSVNDLTQILYIGAKYKSHDISQYLMPLGSHIFVFTFTDVDTEIEKAVLSTFGIVD